MRRAKPALFVQQRTYKRRRMADAARMLPILGGILFIIPLLWIDHGGEAGGTRTGAVMIYLFVVWAALTGTAGVLSRRLKPDEDAPEDDMEDEGDGSWPR